MAVRHGTCAALQRPGWDQGAAGVEVAVDGGCERDADGASAGRPPSPVSAGVRDAVDVGQDRLLAFYAVRVEATITGVNQ